MAWRQALHQELPSDAVRVYNADQFANLLAPDICAGSSSKKNVSRYSKSRSSPGMNGASVASASAAAHTGAAIVAGSSYPKVPGSQQNSAVSSLPASTGHPSNIMNASAGSSMVGGDTNLMERALIAHRQALKNPHHARKNKLSASQSRLFEDTERKKQAWARSNKEMVKRLEQKREAKFMQNWTSLHAGPGFELHKKWGKHLDLIEAEKHNRKKLLSREWNEKVYEPIMEGVRAHAEDLRLSGIHQKRREEYQNFIDVVNLKGGVFLDEVDEAEYDPGVMNRTTGRITLNGIEDPTIRTLQRHHEEIMMNPADMHSSQMKRTSKPGGLPHAKGKSTLDIKVWGKGKIEATPHGHFAAMHDCDMAVREIADCAATRVTLGNGYFNHYNMPISRKLMNTEWVNRFGKGKKCTVKPKNEIQLGDRIG